MLDNMHIQAPNCFTKDSHFHSLFSQDIVFATLADTIRLKRFNTVKDASSQIKIPLAALAFRGVYAAKTHDLLASAPCLGFSQEPSWYIHSCTRLCRRSRR